VPAFPGNENVVVTSVVPFLANVIANGTLVADETFVNFINGRKK
jgi:hypothetical protein